MLQPRRLLHRTLPYTPSTPTCTTTGSTPTLPVVNTAWVEGGPGVIPVRYQVLRSVGTGSTPLFVVGVRAFHERAHQDFTVGSGASYKFKVAAINGSGTAESSTRNVTTPAGSRPAMPYDMAAVWSSPAVIVSWYDCATNETGFEIERSDNGGAFALLTMRPARSGSGATSYTDSAVAAGNTYTYRVRSVRATGGPFYSDWSAQVTVTVA